MIRSLAIVFVLALAGDVIVSFSGLPVPGPAVGLVLLAIGFAFRGGVDDGTARLFDTVAPHFPMFFIPAAVGIIAHIELVASAWVYIVAAITLSTAATIIFSGWVAKSILNAVERPHQICQNS